MSEALDSLPFELDLSAVKEFCRKWRIEEMSLFGSVLRDDFTEDSDVDVLVRFEGDRGLTLTERDQAIAELSGIFGRETDMVALDALMWWRTLPRVRDGILSTAERIYAKP